MELITGLSNGIDWYSLGNMILRVIAILVCLVVHEVSHGFAAYKLGDPTAKQSERLSLNPLKHLDIFGTLMMLLAGFGWAKPVPVNPMYFRNPKRGMAITALAGPLSNFVLGYIAAIFVNGTYGVILARGETTLAVTVLNFFYVLLLMNIGLGIFNLIPFPPLDGSKVVAMFLPDKAYIRWMQLERYGMILLMVLLVFGVLDPILYAARSAVENWMLTGSEFACNMMVKLLS